MKNILFVCQGNICRSPMAEYYFRYLVRQAGLEEQFLVASAATSNEEEGNPVYPLAKRQLASIGIGCKGKVSQPLTAKMCHQYDYIVAMDTDNLNYILRICDAADRRKVSLLLNHVTDEHAELSHQSVADPWYTRRFDIAWNQIRIGCEGLLQEILADNPALQPLTTEPSPSI